MLSSGEFTLLLTSQSTDFQIFVFSFHHGDTTRSGGRAVMLPVGYTMPSTGKFALFLTLTT